MKKAVDLACFSSPAVQDNFRKIILENCKMKKSSNGRSEMVRILAHLTDNPNAPDENGRTPIYLAASNGHAEIVKILVQWTDNPLRFEKPFWIQFFKGQIIQTFKLVS